MRTNKTATAKRAVVADEPSAKSGARRDEPSSEPSSAGAARSKSARKSPKSSEPPQAQSARPAPRDASEAARADKSSASDRGEPADESAAPNGVAAKPMLNGRAAPAPAGLASASRPTVRLSDVPAGGQEGATVAPPARKARKAQDPAVELGDDGDEQIWGDGLAARDAEPPTAFAPHELDEEARAISEPASRLTRGSSGDRLREAAAFGSAQSLLSTDYYFRQYGARGMRSLLAEVDDFGFDPHVDEKVRPILEAVCKRYFRVEVVGSEHIPANGRALLVANRSGALPWDGLVLRTALRAQRPELAALRWLSEDSVIHYPFMGVMMNRLGAVRACPENAERLLSQNRLVAVFPEGAQGARKLFRDRYRLQRFGRGGYVKLALKFDVPILPTAIIGGEETNPMLGQSRLLARFLGRETFPITPTFPWLGPAGLLPAPVRWRIVVGEPIDLSAHGSAAADDALVVHRLNEQIRSSLQALVDQAKRTRGGALFR